MAKTFSVVSRCSTQVRWDLTHGEDKAKKDTARAMKIQGEQHDVAPLFFKRNNIWQH